MVNRALHDSRVAAQVGDLDCLKSLLVEFGADSVRGSGDDPEEFTSLHLAAAGNHLETIEFLLSEEVAADVNALVGNNFSPLHAAAMQGNSEACDRLLAAGADPNVQTQPQGYAPLHSASWGGHQDAVKILLKFGARKDLKNYRNETPEETANRQGHAQVVDTLRTP